MAQKNFVEESKAALLLILLNVYGFIFAHFSPNATEDVIKKLVLLPENLTSGNYWCIITSGFIHVDWMHLILNMLGLFAFGRVVERHLGFWKTILIFFLSLILSMFFATAVNTYILNKDIAIIGASGAVMGLLSAAMLLDPYCITYEMIFPIPVMMKGWLYFYADLMGLLYPDGSNISHLAHMFGFLSIIVIVYFLSKKDKKMIKEGFIVNIASLTFFFLVWKFFFK